MNTRTHDQSFPFSLISGKGPGASCTSNQLADILPDRSLNAGQTSLAINAANGNAVIKDKPFLIHDADVIQSIGMVWNSHDKQFRLAAVPVIKDNSGYLSSFIWDPTLTLTEPDGTVVTYTLNRDGVYTADKIGVQGLSTIKKTDQGFERFFPGNGLKETYNSAGKLIIRSCPPAATIKYDHQNESDLIITLPSGRKIRYETDPGDVLRYHLMLDDKTLATYQFSADKQALDTHLHQPDGSIYKTTYHQTDNRLTIISDDDTTSSLTFNPEGEIQQCAMGKNAGQTWQFSLDQQTRCMKVCDQNKKIIAQVTTDANCHLEAVTCHDFPQTHYFQYSEAGQLQEAGLCDASNQTREAIQSIDYDPANGLPRTTTLHQFSPKDAIQKTCTYYSGQNEKLSGVKLSEYVTQHGQTRTTWYVYNGQRQLCYLITPAGRVTQFEYEKAAPFKLQCQKQVVTQRFNVVNNSAPTLDAMQAWWENTLTAEDKQSLQVTQPGYDVYGRENEKTCFTSASQQGEGLATPDQHRTISTLDAIGRETQTEIETSREQDRAVSSFITTRKYDALDRTTRVVKGAQEGSTLRQETRTTYNASQTTTEHANGLRETITQDTAGRLKQTERTDTAKNQPPRTGSVDYPSLILKQVKREDGQLEHHYHDALSRLQYRIQPDRVLMHYQYDESGRLTHENTYVLPEGFDIKNPVEDLVRNSALTLEQINIYDHQGQGVYDVVIKNVNDEQGKPQRTGHVTEHHYQFGRKVHTTAFAQPLDVKLLNNVSWDTLKSAMLTPDDHDRIAQHYHDADGVLVGTYQTSHLKQADGKTGVQGFLKEVEVDGAGNCYHEITYLLPSAPSSDLEKARPAVKDALDLWHWFDGAGRKIATLDADRCVTLFEYFADGKLKKETRLYHPQNINTDKRQFSHDQLKRDDYVDGVTTYAYDDLRRTSQITHHRTQLEINIEYDANNNETKRVMKDLQNKDSAPRIVQKSYNAFDELEHEASARISAKAGDDKNQWAHHEYHPQTGLKLRTIDAKGSTTLYYYNAARLPVLEIAANGAVQLFEYQPDCNKPSKVYAFYQALSKDQLTALRSDANNTGFITDAIRKALPQPDAKKDRTITREYDAEDSLLRETEVNGAQHVFQYDSFNQVQHEQHLVDQNQWLHIHHERDLRGNAIQTTRDPDGLRVVTQAAYQDALNRPTSKTGELGHTHQFTYVGLCETIITDVVTSARKRTTIDAFKRPSIETDWAGQETRHHYDDKAARSHTVTSPTGSVTTDYQNAFGETTRIVAENREHQIHRGVDGQVEKTIHPDQSETVQQYDVLGLKTLTINANHHVESYQRNAVGQIEKREEGEWRDGEAHLTRTISFTPNVFGENESTTSAAGVVKQTENDEAHRTVIQTTDPENLQLITRQQTNYSSGLTQLTHTGGSPDAALYVETIKRDVLNRETGRHVDMGDGKTLLLNVNTHDRKGNITSVKQADGSFIYNLFDVCNQLRVSIDAEGFAVFIDYDLNQRETSRTQYHERLTSDQIEKLKTASSVSEMKAVLASLTIAHVNQTVRDADANVRFEVEWSEKGEGRLIATLTEYQYNTHGEKIERVDYANVILPDEQFNPSRTATLSQWKEKVLQSSQINLEHDRVTVHVRNQQGKTVFKRDAEGYLVEKRHDVNGRMVAQVAYSDQYINVRLDQDPLLVRAQLKTANPRNRTCYFVYDHFGRLRYEIDRETFAGAFTYNNDDKESQRTGYAMRLKDALSEAEWNTLKEQLGQEGTARNTDILLSLLEKAEAQLKDPRHDVVTIHSYDTAGRKNGETDAANFTEKYVLDALGQQKRKIDRLGHEWTYEHDRAKRLSKETTPALDVTTVRLDHETSKLQVSEHPSQKVETVYTNDDIHNETQVSYADNLADDKRGVKTLLNKNRQVIGTVVEDVYVDNGLDTRPTEGERPDIKVTLTTTIVRDYAGREIVNVDAEGVARFTLYDGLGRMRFQIDGDGYVTEHQFEHAFREPTQIVRYEENIDHAVLASHAQTGLTLSTFAPLFAKVKDKDKRTITMQHDRCGMKVKSSRDSIITAALLNENEAKSEITAPTTEWKLNAFGEVVRERVLLSQGKWAETIRDYDHNGNMDLTVSPEGHVTVQQFGMRDVNQIGSAHVCLSQTVHDTAIDVKEEDTLEQIRAKIPAVDEKTRQHDYQHDNRLLQTDETITAGDMLYETHRDAATGEIRREPVGRSVHYGTGYDAERRPIAHESPSGEVRYIQRDARGTIVAETDFPIQTTLRPEDPESKTRLIPLVKHAVNAHQQMVGTKKFHRSATVTKDEKGRIVISEPKETDERKDQQSYVATDNTGNVTALQNHLGGELEHTTYNRCKLPVRSYKRAAGYRMRPDKTLERVRHLRGKRAVYDRQRQMVMDEKYDAFRHMQTHRRHNAYGECVAEGPAKDDMRVHRRFDKSGFKWYSNEENRIPTVSFPDANGRETATCRSPETDLSQYQDDQQKARENLLDKSYHETFLNIQRSLLVRDREDNVLKQQTPWYRKQSEYTPQHQPIAFWLVNIRGRHCIAWKQPAQFMQPDFTHTGFRLKCKGTDKWADLKVHPQDDGTFLVDVNDFTADDYQYELNFHFRDKFENTPRTDSIPSFQATGSVMLDTNKFDENSPMIQYLVDDSVLVLMGGKTADITGIELWKDNQPVKRVGAVPYLGRLIVDLSREVTGDYAFRVVKNDGTTGDVLHDRLCLRTFQPGQKLTAKEVSVTGFNVKRYCITHTFYDHRGHEVKEKTETAFRYAWNCNHPGGNHELMRHSNVQLREIAEFRQFPPQPENRNFQVILANPHRETNFPPPGHITSYISSGGAGILPTYAETPPYAVIPNDPNHGPVKPQLLLLNKYVKEIARLHDESRYPDAHTLSFTPALPGAHRVEFQHAIINAKGDLEWLPIKDAVVTPTGMAVPLHSFNPGLCPYRFAAFDAQNQRIDLTALCGPCDKDGWYTGEMTVRKGNLSTQTFFSEPKPPQFDTIRPVSTAEYDAWHNRTSETDRKGNKTLHEFNLFNEDIRTTAAPVESCDEHGVKTTGPLVTEHFVNRNGHTISVRSPNGGESMRVVNAREHTLYQTDADFQATAGANGTAHFHKSDVFGRHLETASVDGGRITSDFVTGNGFTTETRVHPGGASEVIETSEAGERIRHRDLAGLETHYGHDGDGHEDFLIGPDRHTEARVYDMRTGVLTENRNRDGHYEKWEIDYFGNAQSHQKISGEVVTHKNNFNQQVVTEKGDISQVPLTVDEADGLDVDICDPSQIRERTRKLPRGSTTEGESPTPPYPRDIKNTHDEAGHLIEIFDLSEQLRTIKSHDANDYCDMYYFVKDGRAYQCVNIERDAMQRITRLQDTKIVIRTGYDRNSNRRFAIAHMIGEDPTEENAVRTSWYDYTVGNRVMLRDCILQAGNISIASGQGMKLDYRRERITTQTTRNGDGNPEIKDLKYHEGNQLLNHIETRERFDAGRDWWRTLSIVDRAFDHALRASEVHQVRHDHKKKKDTGSTEITDYKKTSHDIEKQTRHETSSDFGSKPEDRQHMWNVRTTRTAPSGRELSEKNVLSSTVRVREKDEDGDEITKYIPYTITDDADKGYFAGESGAASLQGVKVKRKFECRDDRLRHDKSIPVEATQTTTQDANGHYASVRGPSIPGSENDAFRSLVTNSEHCIVYKQTEAGRNYYIYAELRPGKMILQAYFGDLVDRENSSVLVPYRPKVVNLDTNHQALSSQYPPPAPVEYTVTRSMTYRELAEELNYTGYASQIAEANNKYEGDMIAAGERIIIKPLYFEIPETAWNGKMPSVDSIIGSLYPALPSPRMWVEPNRPKGPNWLSVFLQVAASAAIMVFLPGALAANTTLLQAIASYAVAGAVSGTVSEVIGGMFGGPGFDIRSVLTSSIVSGITGGVLQQNGLLAAAPAAAGAGATAVKGAGSTLMQNAAKMTFDQAIRVAAEITVAQHAVLLATGIGRKFGWSTVGAAAFNATAGYVINRGVGNPLLNLALNTGVTSIGDSLIMGQKIDAACVTASMAGAVVGNHAGNHLAEANSRRAREEAGREKAAPGATPKQQAMQEQKQAEKMQKPVNDRRAHAEDQRKTRAERWNASRAPARARDELEEQFASANRNLRKTQRQLMQSETASEYLVRMSSENSAEGAAGSGSYAGLMWDEVKGHARSAYESGRDFVRHPVEHLMKSDIASLQGKGALLFNAADAFTGNVKHLPVDAETQRRLLASAAVSVGEQVLLFAAGGAAAGAGRLGLFGGTARVGDVVGVGNARLISSTKRVSSNIANQPFLNEKALAEGWNPPYPADLSLREITASENLPFVRVHTNPNQPGGGFLVREKTLQRLGYDSEAIRLHLGLPDMPIYISDANIPAQTRLMVGRIGAQPNFGLMKSSGFQYQLLEQVPLNSFSNTRLLSELQQSMNPSLYMKSRGTL